MKKPFLLASILGIIVFVFTACATENTTTGQKENNKPDTPSENTEENEKDSETEREKEKEQEKKKNPLDIDKPDAVRGVYVTGHSAGGERFNELLDLMDNTDLNSMVIDIKDDLGNITYEPDKKSELASFGEPYIKDPEKVLKTLEKHDVYPIARIVAFKDTVLAEENPDLSFQSGGEVWHNGGDDAFVSPFQKEVWEHNLAAAKEAAEMGFKEIQFDYVRFPEGFENRADELDYDKGDYADVDDDVEARVNAVTDFVSYAEEELKDYDVDVSVDIFGYTAIVPSAPGIGQDLVQIGEHIDVLSSMIYPSHWGEGSMDIDKPDLEPYEVAMEYAAKEKEKLFAMDNPPVSRPWIQDFTASWLGSGNYQTYGKEEVEAQIRGLNESGIDEYLLWNASNNYSEDVDYKPSLDEDVMESIKKEDKKLRKEIEKEQKEKDNEEATEEENDSENVEKED